MAAAEVEPARGGWLTGLLRALGTMLGVHLQYAQREAAGDVARLLGALLVLAFGILLVACGLVLAHLALVLHLVEIGAFDRLGALAVVGAGDLVLGLLLLWLGRARMRRPILAETRTLMRRTVSSLAETAAGE